MSKVVDFESFLQTLSPKARRSFFEPKKVGFYALGEVEAELEKLGVKAESFFDFELPFYLVEAEQKSLLTTSKLFNSGRIYIQNASSFLCANLLDANERLTLEMCAAPGGKSIILAQKTQDLAVMEKDRERFFKLKANLKKYGCGWVKTFCKDARSVAHTCAQRFERVLLDAPCSAYSHFNENFRALKTSQLKELSRLQKGLLNAALTSLKSGGEVLYSTCTFFEEENEEVVKNALNSKFGVEVLPLSLPQTPLLQTSASEFGTRVLPNEVFEGFFICKLKKL